MSRHVRTELSLDEGLDYDRKNASGGVWGARKTVKRSNISEFEILDVLGQSPLLL
jgi:hypothetical protein